MKILTMEKKDCCGCRACEQICPKNAITMKRDNEGYAYPAVDDNLCIGCNLCERVCGFDKKVLEQKNKDDQKYFWVKNKNEEERKRSRSGGFFYILAKWIIEQGGVVYGCILDDDNYVKHIRATDLEGCMKMQGSKYVESDIDGIYKQVKKDIAENKKVLFSGTGCQVSGLYGFLQNDKDNSNLYTVDIVCHGVCSPTLLKEYVNFWETKKKGRITDFNFRDKVEFGWEVSIESFVINGRKYSRKEYNRLFYCHNAMRPSCANCVFANVTRVADFTLADFWGVDKYYPELNDHKGISSIFVNNDRALDTFMKLTDGMHYGQVNEESIMQPNLTRPTPERDKEAFWQLYEKEGFVALMKKYAGYDLPRRIKWYISYNILGKKN